MNVVSLHDPLPIDVTFFIGPIESPPEFKEAYQEANQKAVEQSAAGNTDLLDELLEIQIQALRDFTEGTEVKPPPLKGLMEALIDGEIGNKKVYDPRSYLKKAEEAMVARLVEASEDLESTGKSIHGTV